MSSSAMDLECKQLVELVTEYLGHALTPDDRARFENHLLTCPPCTMYLAQMRATVEMAGELGAAEGDRPEGDRAEAAEEALLALFRSWQRPL